MVSATTVKEKSLFLTFCLMLSPLTLADSDNGRHWSEGIYFPAQTAPQQQVREPYVPPGRSNIQPGSSDTGRTKYNPWVLQRKGDSSRRFPSYESMGYPSQDYDPYRNRARDSRNVPPVQEDPYPHHPGDFAAAEYFSGQSRHGLETSPPRSEYRSRDYGRIYNSRPYVPDYGMDSYIPFLDSTNLPWTGLNPFFMYGTGSPYLPYWW